MRLLQRIASIHYLFYWLDLLLLFVFYAIKRVYTQQTFVGFQDVLKTSSARLQRNNFRSCKTSWRGLEDVFKTSPKTSSRRLGRRKNVTMKASSRRLEDVLKTCLEGVLKTYLEDVFKTSQRQTKVLLVISVSNKSRCVSNKSLFHKLYLRKLRRIQNPKANPIISIFVLFWNTPAFLF